MDTLAMVVPFGTYQKPEALKPSVLTGSLPTCWLMAALDELYEVEK